MSGFIGRFKILREIGLGGAGRIYSAYDPLLKRDVALKVLLAGEFADETQLGRFQREMESCAKLRHRNIVPLYEMGREEGKGVYMVMEYVDGPSLKDYVRQKISPHQAAQIVCTLARAVHYAHEQGIIHRDIKPQNVLMRDNELPMLTDFGLARKMDAEAKDRLTKTGDFVGTPGYMAPEQINGEAPTPQMDVYGLGAVFFELLTGQPPYEGEPVEILYHILDETESSPAPRQRKSEISRDLDAICQKAMDKDYRRRYQTAGDLAKDIDLYLQGKPIRAARAMVVDRAVRWARRHSVIVLTAALCILGLAIALVVSHIVERAEILSQVQACLERGDAFRKAADSAVEDALWLTQIRNARNQFEIALALDFRNEKAREAICRMEISYGRQALQRGLLERAEDAISAAEAMGSASPELEELKGSVREENRILDVLSHLRQMKPDDDVEEIVRVLRRYPHKGFRYLIANLVDDGTRPLAEKVLAGEIARMAGGDSPADFFALSSLSEQEAAAFGKALKANSPEKLSALLAPLRSADLRSVKTALIAIQSAGWRDAIPDLLVLLSASDSQGQSPILQLHLCRALSAIPDPQATDGLCRLLAGTESINVAIACAEALARIGPAARNSVPFLGAKMDPPSPVSLRLKCFEALLRIDPAQAIPRAVAIFSESASSLELYLGMWSAAARRSDPEFLNFVRNLPEIPRFRGTQWNFQRLGESDRSGLAKEIARLVVPDVDAGAGQKILRILAELDTECRSSAWEEALSFSEPVLRREAAFFLWRCGQKSGRAHSRMETSFIREPDGYARFYLGWALKDSDCADIEPYAQRMLREGEALSRLAAALVLRSRWESMADLLEMLTRAR